jgi:hypothetical protein
MRRQILKRLETLERAADTEVFANALVYPIAYYLGGAKHVSEAPRAIARALGYHDLEELCRALVALLRQPLYSLGCPSDLPARAGEAQRELFAKFGYDSRPTPIYLIYGDRPRPSPAFADAAYRIVATLPDEWRAAIKSAHREGCETEAMADEILQTLDRAIRGESKYARRTKPRQRDRPEGK